jgi:hypothetical protein
LTNSYDLWTSPPTWKKIAFDVPAEVAVHWINKLVTDKGRGHVRDHVKMMYWPENPDHGIGIRFNGRELLDFMDSCKLYGVPA